MHFFQKFRVHFVATNLEMKSGLFTSGSYRRASVGLTDNQLGMSQNHQSHPVDLGCVRFGNIEERDGTVPRFSLVRVFGSCEERNQLVPQKGIFP